MTEQCELNLLVSTSSESTESPSILRAVFGQETKGKIQGKIVVHKTRNTQKLNSKIKICSCRIARKLPANREFEFYEDDVRCSHGATAGHLDKEALFYLNSRGIETKNAKRLLLQAFINPIVSKLTLDAFAPFLNYLDGWLYES